jgi:hypothetical protein
MAKKLSKIKPSPISIWEFFGVDFNLFGFHLHRGNDRQHIYLGRFGQFCAQDDRSLFSVYWHQDVCLPSQPWDPTPRWDVDILWFRLIRNNYFFWRWKRKGRWGKWILKRKQKGKKK